MGGETRKDTFFYKFSNLLVIVGAVLLGVVGAVLDDGGTRMKWGDRGRGEFSFIHSIFGWFRAGWWLGRVVGSLQIGSKLRARGNKENIGGLWGCLERYVS